MCGESFPDTTTFCPKDGSALRAAVHGDDLIGELIAERYLITDLLSQGGMGAVYLASDVRLPQQFAIKVLRQQQTSDPSVIQRFRQEAEAVCRINHDRVARVFDFGFMPDDRAYIVMEYVAGRTLKQLIEERGALDPVEAAKITLMAAEGIDAAHRLGIVHRDLKPENIMTLDDPGGGLRVKVLDFGIAKLENAESGGYTQPGFVIGTPAWMSPEQLTGGQLNARSDIYSLALVSFALLSGQRAFTGDSEQAEMLARISVPPRSLTDAAPHVEWPAYVQALFDRALSRDVNQRPATTVQFATMLVDAMTTWKGSTGERQGAAQSDPATPTAAKRATPAVGGPAKSSSNRTLVMAVVGVTVVGAAALAVVLSQRGGDAVAAGSESTAAVAPPTIVQTTDSAPPPDSVKVAVGDDPIPVTTTPPGAAPNPRPSSPAAPPGNAREPVANPRPADPPPAPLAGTTRDAELLRVMDAFDNGSGAALARETIQKIEAMRSRLSALDQAWGQIYIGNAHFALGDKTQACAAWERAPTLAPQSKAVRDDSEEKRLGFSCRP